MLKSSVIHASRTRRHCSFSLMYVCIRPHLIVMCCFLTFKKIQNSEAECNMAKLPDFRGGMISKFHWLNKYKLFLVNYYVWFSFINFVGVSYCVFLFVLFVLSHRTKLYITCCGSKSSVPKEINNPHLKIRITLQKTYVFIYSISGGR